MCISRWKHVYSEESLPGKTTNEIVQPLFSLVCDGKNFSPAGRPGESECAGVDSSVLVRQKARESDRGGGGWGGSQTPRGASGLVWRHPSPCQLFPVAVYTHLMPHLPVPPILPASLLRGAPSAVMHINALWGMEGRKRGIGRSTEAEKGIEGGLGSAVRPRQQSESIKSVGLLLHWVVINRSWTLSPARRADRVNEGPKSWAPPTSHSSSQFSLSPSLSLTLPFLLVSHEWGKSKEAKILFLLLVKRAKTHSCSTGF